MQSPISQNSWKYLFKLAVKFQRLAPWEWMYHEDIFGVQDPVSKEIGFCSVQGADKLAYGLAVYKGQSGLLGYESFLQEEQYGFSDPFSYQHNCLLLQFQLGEHLSSSNRLFLVRYGFQVRDDTYYPVFKDYEPGWLPWNFETEDQAQKMIVFLEQSLAFADRFKQDADLLDSAGNAADFMLVRESSSIGGTIQWSDHWKEISINTENKVKIELNTLFLRSNCMSYPTEPKSWLADVFYFPRPIKESDLRPYVPMFLLLVNQEDKQIIQYGLFKPDELSQRLQSFFTQTVRQVQYRPLRIIANQKRTYLWWEQLTKLLGIELLLSDSDPVIENVKDNMFKSLAI